MERNGDIEWYRFLAASLVVISHFKYFGIICSIGEYGGYTVELFFLLTGYFTACHFVKEKDQIDIEKVVTYCFRKMLKLLPLATIATISMHLLIAVQQFYADGTFDRYWETFKTLPFDLLLITQFYINRPTCPTLWYLSVLFINLPILCLIASSKNRSKFWLSSFFVLMLYIGGLKDLKIGQWGDLIRGFVFMLSGGGVFLLSEIIKEKGCVNQIVGIFVEKVCLYAGFVMLLFFQLDYKLLVLLWICGLIALFSHTSKYCFGRIKRLLGKASIPIYILHWPLGIVIALLLSGYNNFIKMVAYISSICFAVLIYYLIVYAYGEKRRSNGFKTVSIKE